MFGNGLSTSPSHLHGARAASRSRTTTTSRRKSACCARCFGIEQLALVYGWSMGAQQAYHWAVLHPERVRRIAALCGTARTSEHNIVFLQSLEAALTADPAWDGTRFTAPPERGFRAFARIYASWAARRRSTARASTASSATRTSRTTCARVGGELPAPPPRGPARDAAHLDRERRLEPTRVTAAIWRGARLDPGAHAGDAERDRPLLHARGLRREAAAIPRRAAARRSRRSGATARATRTRTPTTRASSAGHRAS